MKRLRYSIIFVLFLGLAVNVSAQRKKVGLVLSGGGA